MSPSRKTLLRQTRFDLAASCRGATGVLVTPAAWDVNSVTGLRRSIERKKKNQVEQHKKRNSTAACDSEERNEACVAHNATSVWSHSARNVCGARARCRTSSSSHHHLRRNTHTHSRLRMFLCSSSSLLGLWLRRLKREKSCELRFHDSLWQNKSHVCTNKTMKAICSCSLSFYWMVSRASAVILWEEIWRGFPEGWCFHHPFLLPYLGFVAYYKGCTGDSFHYFYGSGRKCKPTRALRCEKSCFIIYTFFLVLIQEAVYSQHFCIFSCKKTPKLNSSADFESWIFCPRTPPTATPKKASQFFHT